MKKNFYTVYKNLALPLKASLWFTICNFILKAISFITVPLFTRYLSTEEYGITSIFTSYQQIFFIFATLELSLGAFQRGILKYKNDMKLFQNSLQLLWSCITIILFLFTLIFKDSFIKLTNTNILILSLMFICFLVQPAYECWINRSRFSYKYKPVVLTTLVFTIFSTGISLFAIIFINQTANVRILSILISQIVFCLPFYIRNIDLKQLYLNKKKVGEYWHYALSFQLPLVLHSLSYLVLAQSDRVMIGTLVGKSEAALYSVAYSLANVLIIFQTSINQVFKPWRYQKMETKDYKSISNITNIMLIIIGMLTLAFILVAPEVMKLLFSEDYYEAVWTIPPIALSVYFMFLYSVFADIESYFSKTKYVMYASVICAIINILLNYIGIKIWGYISCGYATLISYILFAIFHYIFMKRVCCSENIKNNIFDVKFVIIFSILLVIIMFSFISMYSYLQIRFLILLIIVLMCICKRNLILGVLKKIK